MAVREELVLDLRGALGQIQTLEREIDDLRRPVDIPVDIKGDAVADVRSIDDRLEEIESSAREVNRELSEMELAAERSVVDFSKMASEMDISEDEARNLTREILEARSAANRTSDAARDVARQMGLSDDEARDFARSVGAARGQMDDLDRATGRVEGGLGRLRTGFGNLVLAAGAFIGIRELGRFASESITAFSSLEESSSKANVVFGEFADTVFEFTDEAPTALGSTQAAAIEAAASFGNLFLSIGLGQGPAAEMSKTMVQLASDIASFNNISVDEAMQKLRSGLVGEAEPLRQVGVLLSEAAVAAKAMELGLGGATGKLTEAEKVQARYAIILDQTTTAQGDFARTSDGIANATKTAVALFEEFKTTVGEALAPAFNELLKQFPLIIDGFEGMVPGIVSAAQALTEFFVPKPGQADLIDFLNFILDLPRGFGEVGTAIGAMGNSLRTIGSTIGAVFNPFDDRSGPEAWAEGVERGAQLAQDSLENINTQGLVSDLRRGADAATALGNRLAEVARKGTLDPKFVKDLTLISGLDFTGASTVLATLINDASRLGLSAEEIEAVRIALAGVLDEARADGPIRNVSERLGELGEVATTRAVPPLLAVQVAASEAGISLTNLLTATDPVATALRETLTPAQETALAFQALRTEGDLAIDALVEMPAAVANVSGALQDLNDDGRTTAAEFRTNLQQMLADQLAFTAGIATIAGIDPLAAIQLSTLPIEQALETIKEIAADPENAEEILAALFPTSNQIADFLLDIFTGAAPSLLSPNPAIAAATQKSILASIDDPGLRAAVRESLTATIHPALAASFADLEIPDVGSQIEGALSQPEAARGGARVTIDAFARDLINELAAERFNIQTDIQTEMQSVLGGVDIGVDFGQDGRDTASTFNEGFTEEINNSQRDRFDLVEEAFSQEDAAASGAARTVEEYRRAVINELAAQRFGFAGDIQEEMQRVLGASNLQIGVDVVPRVAAGSVGSGGGTVIVNNTINNPTTTDLPTATAQLEQSTSSTATLLNRVTQQ